jgi:ATP-dependent Clp protease ATP-binding subunit ClpX
VVTSVSALAKSALLDILVGPKNALIKQYQRMFELDGVRLEFEQDALESIAELAVLRQTGARGLRAIMEEVLGPIMFEVPSTDHIETVIVTRDAVVANAAPTIVTRPSAAPDLREKSA